MSISPLKRWSAIALLVFTLTLACGLCLIALTPKVYEATTQIQIKIPVDDSADRAIEPNGLVTEFPVIQSRKTLMPIVLDLGFNKRKWGKWGSQTNTNLFLVDLRSHLKLELNPGTSIIRITYSSDVPIEAANIANAIADRYKTMRDVAENQSNIRGDDALRSQIAQQEKVVTEKRAVVDDIKKSLTSPRMEIAPDESDEAALDKLQEALLAAQEDHDARRVLVNRMATVPDDQYIGALHALGGKEVVPDDKITPKVQIAALRRTMLADCDAAKSRADTLQTKVDVAKANLDRHPHNKFSDALHDLEQQQSILDALNVRIRQVSPDIPLPESPVRILSRAEPPSHPIQPHIPLDLFGSAFAGLLLGITVASFVELLLWLRR